VGIYGVRVLYGTQREPENGIRMALGAFLATRLMETLLFSVKPTEPATFGGIAPPLLGVAFFAPHPGAPGDEG
jgi:hypothetical protein